MKRTQCCRCQARAAFCWGSPERPYCKKCLLKAKYERLEYISRRGTRKRGNEMPMKDLKLNDLVVMNHEPGATLFRVKKITGNSVALIDSTLEEQYPNQRFQWQDITVLLRPNKAQLDRGTYS